MSLAIEAFIDNVKRFCEWHESDSHEIEPARQILLALMQGIPALYTTGLDTFCSTEYEFRGHDRWKSDHERLADLPIQYYRAVFDPLQFENEESVIGDLHDDLADIYGDLWHGLQGYNAGDIGYAIDHWRTSYDQHWGHHAATAVHAIDAYFRSCNTTNHRMHDESPS